ncbi:MAG: hypothetical protein ACXVHT_04890 [Methanobacterium sp.]
MDCTLAPCDPDIYENVLHEFLELPYLLCPHCDGVIHIEQINCGIFRHGTYNLNAYGDVNNPSIDKNLSPLLGLQMPPHASKELCEKVYNNGQIYGCGKPFRYDGKKIEKCDYV